MKNLLNVLFGILVAVGCCTNIFAQEAKVGSINISGAYAVATVPGQLVAEGFMKLMDMGPADQLVGASSPVATEVQLHTMSMDGNTMHMSQLKAVDIPANGSVELKKGGMHLMLMGLKAPLKAGDTISIKLKFAKAGEVEVKFPVKSMGDARSDRGSMKM